MMNTRRPVHERLQFLQDRLQFPRGRVLESPVHWSDRRVASSSFPSRSQHLRHKLWRLLNGGTAPALFCIRCLASGHVRSNCSSPIKCRACFASRHVEASCPRPVIKPPFSGDRLNGKMAPFGTPGWFKKCATSGPSQPPIFNSFGDWAMTLLPPWAQSNRVPEAITP